MLNKEDKDTYMVTVTATDPSGLSATINVTIKVTNVDEPPELIWRAMDYRRVRENRTDAVETYTATDDEDDKAGTAITWSLLDGTDAADFKIILLACSLSRVSQLRGSARMAARGQRVRGNGGGHRQHATPGHSGCHRQRHQRGRRRDADPVEPAAGGRD